LAKENKREPKKKKATRKPQLDSALPTAIPSELPVSVALAPDAFMKVESASSPIMFVIIWIVNLMAAALPMTWVRRFVFPYLRSTHRRMFWTRFIVDAYLVLIIAIEVAALALARPDGPLIFPILAVYGLWDLLVATLRDLIINPSKHRDKDGPFLLVQDPIRWFALFPTAPAQAILCFAVLFVHFSHAMGSAFLEGATNALYFSFCTFFTVGSSAVTPDTTLIGQVLVAAEIVFFVTILTTKLPLAIALTRAKSGGGAADNG
jgi:hypothetical protein